MSHQIKINLPNENSASPTLQPIIISWTNPSTDNQSQMIDEKHIKQEDELQIISQVIQHPANKKAAEIVSPTRVLRSHGKVDKSPVIVTRKVSPRARGGSKTQDVEVFTKVIDITSKSMDALPVNGDSSLWTTTVHKNSKSQATSNKIESNSVTKASKKLVKILPKKDVLQESKDESVVVPKVNVRPKSATDVKKKSKAANEVKPKPKTTKAKQLKKDKNGNSLKLNNLAPKASSILEKSQSSSPLEAPFNETYIKKEEELNILPENDTKPTDPALIKIEVTDQQLEHSTASNSSTKPQINAEPAVKDEAVDEITIKVINLEPKAVVKEEESRSCISDTTSSPLKYFNVSSSSKVNDSNLIQNSNKFVHLSKYLSDNVKTSESPLDVNDQSSTNSEKINHFEAKEPAQDDDDDDDDDEDRLVIKEDEVETIDISDSDDEKPEESAPKKFQNSWTDLTSQSITNADSDSLTSSNHVSISYPSIDGSTSLQPPVIQISYQFPMDSQHSASSTQIQKHFMSSSMEPIHKNLGQQSTFGQLFNTNHHHAVQPVFKDHTKINSNRSSKNVSPQPSTSQIVVSTSSNKPQTSQKRRRSSLMTPSTSNIPQTTSKSLENPSKKQKVTADPNQVSIIPYIPSTNPTRRISSTSSDGSSSTSHPFQCKMCMTIFKRKIDMIHHLKSHSEAKFECQRCGMKFKFEGYFIKHECIACELCNKTFFLKQQLRNHQRIEHDIQMEMYECDLCGKKLRYRHGVLYHMSKTHMKYLEDKYGCDVCGKRFKLKESIRLHIKNHESVIECKLCDKKVKRVNLNVHMKSVHATERNFKCRICRTSFKTKECLKSHIRTHEKSFECTECGKRFSNKSHLKEHVEWHKNPDAYKCKICQKSFAQKYCLKAHVKLHESGHQFTKFKCSSCPYSTDKAENLEKHELKHKRQEENEEMRKNWLQCEKCPVKLKNKLKLATHYWKKHSEVMPK
ncbi:unnamed protein product [Chironomus riparius]|uniref:C2H2-type domain-containing protein n=1 Tax=Chironomus riparius TaxID=315576 RepID=A0A9N9S7H0_9DIPT|nr:unnamed protein product [Chironomus riparius]